MDIRYPIGKFAWTLGNTREQRAHAIDELAAAPGLLRESVAGFTEPQLDTPYREGGWTLRQVVHHLPDSHMNSYIRIKVALTEDQPTIKPYDENMWANLVDGKSAPIEPSLNLLDGLHRRWVMLLRSLPETEFRRRFIHPEHGTLTVDQYISMCAWHGKHHVAHITALRERNGW